MRPTAKTVGLAFLAVALLVLNLVDPGGFPGGEGNVRILPSISEGSATRIEMSSAEHKVVLERNVESGRWTITAPIDHPADTPRVRAVLHALRNEIQVDVRVDTGNLADYGLDASGGIVVEVWTDQEEPEVSFTVGRDAPGASSFIRLSGDDGVYRARVGGRARFDRRPAEWRNRVVLDFSPSEVQELSITPPSGAEVHLTRAPSGEVDQDGSPLPGPWTVDPDPGWGLDATGLQNLIATMGRLRAHQILANEFEGGFSPPAAELTVMRNDGTESVMAIGTLVTEGRAHVRVTGGSAVYAVPAKPLARFMSLEQGPVEDRGIFQVDRSEISKLILWEGQRPTEAGPDPDTGIWRLLSGDGSATDVAEIDWAIDQLSRLQSDGRLEGLSYAASGVSPPNMIFEVQRQDGTHEALYVGRAVVKEGQRYLYVGKQNGKDVHIISAARIKRLRKAFGKG